MSGLNKTTPRFDLKGCCATVWFGLVLAEWKGLENTFGSVQYCAVICLSEVCVSSHRFQMLMDSLHSLFVWCFESLSVVIRWTLLVHVISRVKKITYVVEWITDGNSELLYWSYSWLKSPSHVNASPPCLASDVTCYHCACNVLFCLLQ